MIFSDKYYQDLKHKTLMHFWGYNTFREPQEKIIDSLCTGKDTLVLLPTGAGKSICYQLPALFLEGTCIVISPLLALMKDQVIQLKNRGIEAEFISSEIEDFVAEKIYNSCKEGITKLLYISPERLTNTTFLQNIEDIEISFIAVDEAHCISEWGQDFRPSYQNIKSFREQFRQVPCIALTATATPKVLNEIQEKIGLRQPNIFQNSFKRENLNIIVENISDKYQRVFDITSHYKNSGIIYTKTRKDAEMLTDFLRSKGNKNVDYYHAGLPAKEKNEKQKKWINSNQNILVATNAFGMGIDKDNVSFVIHFSPPISIENYYQEIGRAGRNGEESLAYLMWNDTEITEMNQIFQNQLPTKTEFINTISCIYSLFQIADGDLTEKTYQISVEKIKQYTKYSVSKIKNILNFLNNQEVIYYKDYKTSSSLELKIKPDEIEFLPNRYAYFLEMLLRNLSGFTTQKVYFSEKKLAHKLSTEPQNLKERIKELQQQGYIDYLDGNLASIKFLKHRDDRLIAGKLWNLFVQIQKNKLQKWEEMKYYISDEDFCKMKMILAYFGEKKIKNCGKCHICNKKKEAVFGSKIEQDISAVLLENPSTLEEIVIKLGFYGKEKVLESVIEMLDKGKVKMKDYKTYILA